MREVSGRAMRGRGERVEEQGEREREERERVREKVLAASDRFSLLQTVFVYAADKICLLSETTCLTIDISDDFLQFIIQNSEKDSLNMAFRTIHGET